MCFILHVDHDGVVLIKIIAGLGIVALYLFHNWCTLSTVLLLLHTQHSYCCHHTRETGLISPPPPVAVDFLFFFLGVVGDREWGGWERYGGSHIDSLGL